MDLVVCRNLLIYLKQDLQQDILDLFAYSLHQTNGFLFLGKAETAPYKYPRVVDFVPELPKTASGKVRRALLRGG